MAKGNLKKGARDGQTDYRLKRRNKRRACCPCQAQAGRLCRHRHAPSGSLLPSLGCSLIDEAHWGSGAAAAAGADPHPHQCPAVVPRTQQPQLVFDPSVCLHSLDGPLPELIQAFCSGGDIVGNTLE